MLIEIMLIEKCNVEVYANLNIGDRTAITLVSNLTFSQINNNLISILHNCINILELTILQCVQNIVIQF